MTINIFVYDIKLIIISLCKRCNVPLSDPKEIFQCWESIRDIIIYPHIKF